MGASRPELSDTRLGLEEAIGADWKADDPSWAPSLLRQAFPKPLRDALSQDATRDAVARAIVRPAPVRDLVRRGGVAR